MEMGWHCGGSPSFRLGDLSPSLGFISNHRCCVLSVCHVLGLPSTFLLQTCLISVVRWLCPHLTGGETDSQKKTKGHTSGTKFGSWEFVANLS